jgi:hypothetical protein
VEKNIRPVAGTLKGARNRDAAGQGASIQNSRQAYVNLALATAAFAVAFAAWSMISPLSHQIQADFNLDNTSIGLLIALPTLLGALMRVPMGVLTDRFGGRKVFTGLLLFTLLPIAFLGFAHSFWSYVVGAFFLGIAGASFAAGVPFVSRWFSADRQGRRWVSTASEISAPQRRYSRDRRSSILREPTGRVFATRHRLDVCFVPILLQKSAQWSPD